MATAGQGRQQSTKSSKNDGDGVPCKRIVAAAAGAVAAAAGAAVAAAAAMAVG